MGLLSSLMGAPGAQVPGNPTRMPWRPMRPQMPAMPGVAPVAQPAAPQALAMGPKPPRPNDAMARPGVPMLATPQNSFQRDFHRRARMHQY